MANDHNTVSDALGHDVGANFPAPQIWLPNVNYTAGTFIAPDPGASIESYTVPGTSIAANAVPYDSSHVTEDYLDPGYLAYYKCTADGLSGLVEPRWGTVTGGTAPTVYEGSSLTVTSAFVVDALSSITVSTETTIAQSETFYRETTFPIAWVKQGFMRRIGIDMKGVAHSNIERVRISSMHYGIRFADRTPPLSTTTQGNVTNAGYFNNVIGCQFLGCTYGLRFEVAGNSNRAIGNHIRACGCGAYIGPANAFTLMSDFERNCYHIICAAGSRENLITGCRFEGGTQYATVPPTTLVATTRTTPNLTRAAILFKAGALSNMEFGNLFSNTPDCIFDEQSDSNSYTYSDQAPGAILPAGGTNAPTASAISSGNTSLSPGVNALYLIPSQIGSGRNLITNPSMEVATAGGISNPDANAEPTVADGWIRATSNPLVEFSLETLSSTNPNAIVRDGLRSQKIRVYAGLTVGIPVLYRLIDIANNPAGSTDDSPVKLYTLSFWFYSSTLPGSIGVRVGYNTVDHAELWFSGTIPSAHGSPTAQDVIMAASGVWRFARVSFRVPLALKQLAITLRVNDVNAAFNAGNLYSDFYIDSMKLEEGGHIETAFGDDILNAYPVTVGPVLGGSNTIAPTNRIHPVSSLSRLDTITAPAGFSGPLTLIPDSLMLVSTAGNIASAQFVQANTAQVFNFNSNTSKWYPGPMANDSINGGATFSIASGGQLYFSLLQLRGTLNNLTGGTVWIDQAMHVSGVLYSEGITKVNN